MNSSQCQMHIHYCLLFQQCRAYPREIDEALCVLYDRHDGYFTLFGTHPALVCTNLNSK